MGEGVTAGSGLSSATILPSEASGRETEEKVSVGMFVGGMPKGHWYALRHHRKLEI